ncbi:MAG: phytoene desaturase [Isosphaeraceae bacterium]|nr:MAG: phytoene desaturase [Isosphaeraceae bacterium]
MSRRAVVIGGGVGGLAAALELRRYGFDVTLCERHGEVGGKARERREAGFRWDRGPSILVLIWTYRSLFEASGLNWDDYVPMKRLDPALTVRLTDGRILPIPADVKALEEAIAAIDAEDARALPRFLAKLDRFAGWIGSAYCDRIFETWPQVMLSALTLSAAILPPTRRYVDEIDSFFRTGAIRELFYGFPTYSGFDPKTAPASLAVIPWTILREGVWYPERGGVVAIPRAIGQACRDRGVEMRLQTEVEAIERDATGRVTGVATSSGPIRADVVISNSDYVHTFRMIRGGGRLADERRALLEGTAEPSTSFYTLELGCDRTWPILGHHLLALTRGSERVYEEVYRRWEYPSDPPLYVNTTSATDPGDAPAGGSNPFVVVGAPPLRPGQERDELAERRFGDRLIERLEQYGLEGLGASIVVRGHAAPADWKADFHAYRGSIYGLGTSHNVLAGNLRPVNVCPDVPGLYLVGGGVQPGPGLPMVVQSGKIVAARVARDLRQKDRRERIAAR